MQKTVPPQAPPHCRQSADAPRVLLGAVQILLFNLPVNFAQGTSIFWAYVIGFHEAPLTAIQVLYVNLVTVRGCGMPLLKLLIFMSCASANFRDLFGLPSRKPLCG